MLTKHNVYFQKVDVTEVSLQLFHNIRSDIYKHTHIRVSKTVTVSCLACFCIKIMLLDKQNKCPYGSCRGGSL